MSSELLKQRTMLVVAHPGHEARLYGWLERARPRVLILTDGSGHTGQPRLHATTKYLAELGVERGTIYGRFTDRAVYDAILRQDFALFAHLADELACVLCDEQIEYVVGDAAEGYNSTHDLCRLIVDAAVARAHQIGGRPIANYDYAVVTAPDTCPAAQRAGAIWLNLDEETFARKLAAARRYYPELLAEVAAVADGVGDSPMRKFLAAQAHGEAQELAPPKLDAFRVECLRPVKGACAAQPPAAAHKPFYELHGEQQVAAGLYDRVIRYREHIAPISAVLGCHVETSVR